MALAMIEGAERDGLLAPGDTVVEYTGGSTGPALALVCRAKGYRALIVMADCFTEERFQLMRALGAEIDVVRVGRGPAEGDRAGHPEHGRPRRRARRAARATTRPTSSTTRTSSRTTASGSAARSGSRPSGRVTAFCQGMGTASSLMGVSDALKPHGVFIQAHEPAGSAAITGGAQGPFLIQGWTGIVMPHWDPEKVDHLEPIDGRRGDRDDRPARARGRDLRRASRPARTSSARTASPSASVPTR